MLLKAAKTLLKSSFHKAGLEVKKKAEAELFDLTCAGHIHPIEAVYNSCGNACLVKVPLTRLVTFDYSAFPLDSGGGHPFVITLDEYKRNPSLSAEHSPLRQYYDFYRPATASELMDIDRPSCPDFDHLPALAATPLWSWKSPEAYCAHLMEVYRKEDEAQGVKVGKFIGASQFGPVAPRKLTIEYARLTRLYDSIKRDGFRPERGEWITGVVWADERDWVIAVSTGQHRLACLAALGHESAIVYLQPKKAPSGIMLRSWSRHFPSVINGFHTQQEALAIFDRIVCKRPPKAADAWLAYCRQRQDGAFHVPAPLAEPRRVASWIAS